MFWVNRSVFERKPERLELHAMFNNDNNEQKAPYALGEANFRGYISVP
jgi:hypothetical protein